MTKPTAHSVLIIDDDASVRRLLSFGLELEGFRTATADNGFTGLRAAVQAPPDVIVLDLMMPGRDGFTVLDGLRSREALAHIPVVLLSARSSTDDLRRASEAGVHNYITKPFDFAHLVWKLREVLANPAVRSTDPREPAAVIADPAFAKSR